MKKKKARMKKKVDVPSRPPYKLESHSRRNNLIFYGVPEEVRDCAIIIWRGGF